jgi:hypothetical protein
MKFKKVVIIKTFFLNNTLLTVKNRKFIDRTLLGFKV